MSELDGLDFVAVMLAAANGDTGCINALIRSGANIAACLTEECVISLYLAALGRH
jgi:hypothetical protein